MVSKTDQVRPGLRVIIYGAGAIGGAVGGHLALSGTDVILVGRPGHINAMQERGLRFITPTGTHTLKIPAVTGPEQIEFGPNDLVFLCVKSQGTEVALRELQAVTKDVPIFCLQNGVRNEEVASRYFSKVHGAMVRIGSEYVTNGEVTVRRDPPGWLIIGCFPRGTDTLAGDAAVILRQAGFHVLVTPDVMPYKWGKLMSNLANSIGAITNAKWEETRIIVQATQNEANAILSQAGVVWISQAELERQWAEMTYKPRHVLTTESQSSTWQSLARHQGSDETDFLNGEIVRLAKQLGTKAPINETLVNITHEMVANRDLPGKHSARELLQMLHLS